MKTYNFLRNLICVLVIIVFGNQYVSAQPDVVYQPDIVNIDPNRTSNTHVIDRLYDTLDSPFWSSAGPVPTESNPIYVNYIYNTRRKVNALVLVSTLRDVRIHDPGRFSLEATNTPETPNSWVQLYQRTDNTALFSAPTQTMNLPISNLPDPDGYTHYRLKITGKPASSYISNIQLAEMQLKGPRILEDLNLEIYQIKVSEGHATLVVVKNIDTDEVVSSTLIDAGKTIADGQLIAKTIIDNADSTLDNVFITHYDRDHYGGLSPNAGLLDQRCKVGNSGEFNIVPANPTVNKLQVYGVKDDTQNKAPTQLKNRMATYITSNTLTFNSWEVDTELSLSGSGNEIKLITLAVNGTLRNGLQRVELSKNNRSGAALIVWGDFTFLIQGDIQGAGERDQIGRTNVFYRPTLQAPTKRIPENWDSGVATVQQAKDLIINPIDPDTPSGSNSGILRLNVNEMDKAGLPAQNPIALVDIENETDAEEALKGLSMFYHKYYIAYPNEWLHQLGGLIDDYNDAGNYAHACVALIPHHGAMSSNAWFDTKYGIISNNARGNHGHPLPQAVEAAYHTAGISDFYFTYLEDGKTYHGKVLDRLTEITNWKNNYVSTTVPFVQDVNFHVLDATQKYFKINVIQDADGEKNFQINNGDALTQSLIQCPNH